VIQLHHVYIFVMAASAVVALVLGSLAWSYRRAAPAAEPFAAMLFGEVVWSGSMALVWWIPTLSGQVFWRGIADIGSVIAAAGFLAAGTLYDAEVSKVCVALLRDGGFEFSS